MKVNTVVTVGKISDWTQVLSNYMNNSNETVSNSVALSINQCPMLDLQVSA